MDQMNQQGTQQMIGGSTGTKLFLGQVPATATEDDVKALFQNYGTITDLILLKDRLTGQPKGCAFVSMSSIQECENAISGLNDKVKLQGAKKEVCVRYAGVKPAEENESKGGSDWKIYVGMLSRHTGEEGIKKLFEPYGIIKELHMITNKDGTAKGAAFIKYGSRDESQRAINALNGIYKDGDAPGLLQVRFAHTKEERARLHSPFLGAGGLGLNLGGGSGGGMGGLSSNVFNQNLLLQQQLLARQQQQNLYLQQQAAQQQNENPQFQQSTGSSWGGTSWNPQQSMQGMNVGAGGLSAVGLSGLGGLGSLGTTGNIGLGSSSVTPSWSSWAPQQQLGMGQTKENRGPTGANLFVYGLPDAYSDSDLNSLFSNFGTVISASIQKDKATGMSKGFGFVSYADSKHASAAIQSMDGLVIGNKRLNVRVKKGDDSTPASSNNISTMSSFGGGAGASTTSTFRYTPY